MKTQALSAAVAATALVLPATAIAAQREGPTCARSATVERGEVFPAIAGDDGRAQSRLLRNRQYFTTRPATFAVGGARYTTARQTTFTLRCEGGRASVLLTEGGVTLVARARRPALVAAREGTVEAGRRRAQTVRVTRTSNLVDLGTTRIRRTRGSGPLAIAPFVGERPGRIRLATGATLVATERTDEGELEGNASFVGLAR
jgi:hypothetical protein